MTVLAFKVDENLPAELAELLRALLGREPLSGKLWIVEPDRVRIWRHWSED